MAVPLPLSCLLALLAAVPGLPGYGASYAYADPQFAGSQFVKAHVPRLEPQMNILDDDSGRSGRTLTGRVGRLKASPVRPALQEVRLGERLELECEVFGSPPPAIQWLHDGQPVMQDDAKSLSNLLANEAVVETVAESNLLPDLPLALSGMAKITSRLVVDCALPMHSGVYACAALTATDSDVSPSATVYVETDGVRNLSALLSACQRQGLGELAPAPRPPRITTFASLMMDVSGTDITLPCAAEGSPRPAVFWKDNNNQVIVPRRTRYKVLPNGSLMILKVRWSDMGIYTCVAQSKVGRDNTTTFVYPLSPEK